MDILASEAFAASSGLNTQDVENLRHTLQIMIREAIKKGVYSIDVPGTGELPALLMIELEQHGFSVFKPMGKPHHISWWKPTAV